LVPDPLCWAGKGKEQEWGGEEIEGGAREREKKKVMPCIGTVGVIAQIMVRWERHV